MPVVPGKNETGTKTEISTSEVAITALVTSPMAMEVASAESLQPSEIWRCTFSMTTMASSTTRPVASVMPKSVSELMEKPKTRMKKNVPIERDRDRDRGMIVARPVLQKEEDDDDDDHDGRSQRLHHLADRIADDGGGIKATTACSPGGKDFESS